MPLPQVPPSTPPDRDLNAIVERLAQRLAANAIERDAAGGHAAAERQAIRESGLLGLSVPTAWGGWGADWPTVFEVQRRLAKVDSALAHLFAFHHLQVGSVLLWGSEDQQARLLKETITERLFWGNALNPQDQRLLASESGTGWTIHGVKSYASGSVGSDRLTVAAWHAGRSAFLIGVVPTRSRGIAVQPDWDSFGQRQTDSGTVSFEQVHLPQADVLQQPGSEPSPRATLRTPLAQLVLVNLYLGIAQGALDQARDRILTTTRPWVNSDSPSAAADPYIQHRFGQLHLLVKPAALLADVAAQKIQAAIDKGHSVTPAERGAVALAVDEAKVLSHRAALEVSSQFFELTGASSTSQKLGLDRYWRNARVHTLHDPVDLKLRDLGRYALNGTLPTPTSYS